MRSLYQFGSIVAILTTSGLIMAFSPLGEITKIASNHEQHQQQVHEMDLGPADADYDLRFIDAMIIHHQGAIAMAQQALANSQRPEIQKLAQEIVEAQEQEIAQLQQWRGQWYPQAPTAPQGWHAGMNHMMAMSEEQIATMRMDVDLGSADEEFDLRFLNAMIPHHEGALVMAEDALAKSQCPEIQQLAQEIIASQQQEIQQMQQWRQAWFNR